MNCYSPESQTNLDTCDGRLQRIFTEALQMFDHSVICGYRPEGEQLALFLEKKTKIRSGGKHNCIPSLAVDAIPFPMTDPNDWSKDRDRMCLFAGMIKALGFTRGIEIRWGGDWDGDNDMKDQKFDDLVHFEIVVD